MSSQYRSILDRLAQSDSRCMHCEKRIGVRRLQGTRFCSESHERAELEMVQAMMMERLGRSAGRLRKYASSQKLQVPEGGHGMQESAWDAEPALRVARTAATD
jgi:hypothetical protein